MKILVVLGTRPEAIKLAPLIHQLRRQFEVKVCVTAQHREMLDQILNFFQIVPDYDLAVMQPNQSLSQLNALILTKMQEVFDVWRPDLLIVQGDTTTTMAASMAAFYNKISIAHVEAGLRSHNMYSPYPEEFNRQVTSKIATWHFCPTQKNKNELLKEGVSEDRIFVTGNTVIDALLWTLKTSSVDVYAMLNLDPNKKIILVTGHRRESFGQGFQQICEALYQIAHKYPNVEIVYPVHLNPNVQEPVQAKLSGVKNIHLIAPLNYEVFAHLMNVSYCILTDSGGIQEEAPSLGKPVLVMRDLTERLEAIESGVAKLVGVNVENIVKEFSRLMDDLECYHSMANVANPYGDGAACEKISSLINEIVNTSCVIYTRSE